LNVEQLGAGMIVLVVVVVAGVSATIVPTQSSTAPSIVPASPVVAQPPFASALAIDCVNFVSAVARQLGSTTAPWRPDASDELDRAQFL
jgi:hypothetical protein